jgi:GNAT superfamily N-acetyltransferase
MNNNLNRGLPRLFTKKINSFSGISLDAILNLEKKCFPKEWQYEDGKYYFARALKKASNLNIFLCCKGMIVGYLLAVPHNDARKEINKFDPLMQSSRNRLYIETVEVLPEHRGRGGSKLLFSRLCREAKRRGVNNFSIHARRKNRLNAMIKKMFIKGLTKARPIERWHFGGNEKYEYIEWSINKITYRIKK